MTASFDPLDAPADRDVSEADIARDLLENTLSHAVFLLDADATITTWPAPAETLYGYEPDATIGRRVNVLFADEEPEGAICRTNSSRTRRTAPSKTNAGTGGWTGRFFGGR